MVKQPYMIIIISILNKSLNDKFAVKMSVYNYIAFVNMSDNVKEVSNKLDVFNTNTSVNKIYNMDCIHGMKKIPSASIDMILCDPPFGLTECQWDKVINIPAMFDEYRRSTSTI